MRPEMCISNQFPGNGYAAGRIVCFLNNTYEEGITDTVAKKHSMVK